MKKTDKKIEKALRQALTDVCEIALEQVAGFRWLTHVVNYNRFPDSLLIVCVFQADSELSSALVAHQDDFLRSLIREKLSGTGIYIKDIAQHVKFDTEQACERDHDGKWQERIR
jgi:hypothetical protein